MTEDVKRRPASNFDLDYTRGRGPLFPFWRSYYEGKAARLAGLPCDPSRDRWWQDGWTVEHQDLISIVMRAGRRGP